MLYCRVVKQAPESAAVVLDTDEHRSLDDDPVGTVIQFRRVSGCQCWIIVVRTDQGKRMLYAAHIACMDIIADLTGGKISCSFREFGRQLNRFVDTFGYDRFGFPMVEVYVANQYSLTHPLIGCGSLYRLTEMCHINPPTVLDEHLDYFGTSPASVSSEKHFNIQVSMHGTGQFRISAQEEVVDERGDITFHDLKIKALRDGNFLTIKFQERMKRTQRSATHLCSTPSKEECSKHAAMSAAVKAREARV